MDKINVFLKSYVPCFLQKRKFILLFSQMSSHLSNSCLEPSLKYWKLNKLMRLQNHLLKISSFHIHIQPLGYLWIQLCWKKMVLENGFKTVSDTLTHLELNISGNILKKSKQAIENILPLNCQISKRSNKKSELKLCQVRPALPGLAGKLYGVCLEIDQSDYIIRIFGLIDPDILRFYRQQIDKQEIIKDLSERYTILFEDAEPYLNCISYRDYLVLEPRKISAKIKQMKEKIDFYKSAELSLLLNEYQFMTEPLRVELTTFLLELGLRSQGNYLYSKIPIPTIFLDWKLQTEIEYNPLSISPKNSDNLPEQVPYEIRISGLNTIDKIKAKAYDKLKIISQSGDGAPKAQKYLDGILKIPFGVIKSEQDLHDPGKELVEELFKKFPLFKTKSTLSHYGNNYLKIIN